jgi:hypothetical protein
MKKISRDPQMCHDCLKRSDSNQRPDINHTYLLKLSENEDSK